MGHYTALHLSGVLDIESMAMLVDGMGDYQASNVIGGQLVYPLMNQHWEIDAEKVEAIEKLLSDIDDLYVSIRLGFQIILGGTDAALSEATRCLPQVQNKDRTFPLKLPFHSAFHTPLMNETAKKAQRDLKGLNWRQPSPATHRWERTCLAARLNRSQCIKTVYP